MLSRLGAMTKLRLLPSRSQQLRANRLTARRQSTAISAKALEADPLLSKINLADVSSTATGKWLLFCSGLAFSVISACSVMRTRDATLVSAGTRGLGSFTLPRTEAEWESRFEAYRASAHFAQLNSDMTLAQFKARHHYNVSFNALTATLAAAYFVPAAVLVARGHVARKEVRRVATLGALVAGYAWVSARAAASARGDGRVRMSWLVSQNMAGFFLFSDLLIYGLGVLRTRRLVAGKIKGAREWRAVFERKDVRSARLWAVLVEHGIVTAGAAGALMAGVNGGQFYPVWPIVGSGAMEARDLWDAELGWWRNWVENPAVVNVLHRALGESTAVLAAVAWAKAYALRRVLPRSAMVWAHAMLGMCVVQVGLGVAAVLTTVHPDVAATHEINAYLTLAATIGFMNATKRLPPNVHLGKLMKSLRLGK